MAERVVVDVCEREIVLLGELPSHGEAQAFQVKSEIVKGLVERCGFDVLLFEAGLYDFEGFADALAEERATLRHLNRAMGRFWWTEGLADWRGWLFEQAQTGRLTLGGLDDQPSATSDHARSALPGLVASALSGDRASGCSTAVDRNLHWRYDDTHSFDEAEQSLLSRCAQEAVDAVAREGTPPTSDQMMLANLASAYSRQLAGAPDRDAVMHQNLLWHRSRQRPARKTVVWTATVHAARQQGPRASKPLGTHLAEQWGGDMAAIGFTAFGGASSMAGLPSQELSLAPEASLEALAMVEGERVYLDASALARIGAVSSRLMGRFTSANWSEYFDGVVVIREETAPVFEAWQ